MGITSMIGKSKIVASITIEHGMIKLLICSGLEVLDYRVLLANPRFFREGQVSNSARVASLLQNVLPEMEGKFSKVIGGLPGFQSRLSLMELPRSSGLNAAVVIPQEASRTMRISTETYYLSWIRLPDRLDRTRWLVLAASRRSIGTFTDMTQRANLKMTEIDLRPFALARAINEPEAVIAWVAPDGCDVIITKDNVPVEQQSLYWGAELVEDTVLVDRLTEIVGRTMTTFDQTSPEGPLSEEAPLYVCGSPIRRAPEMANQVATNLQREAGELVSPLTQPPDFPIQDLVVNIGLILREA